MIISQNVTIVKIPPCLGDISSSTEYDIMSSSKLKHLGSSDCEGFSSDSGFSDLSGYLPTLLAENPHNKCNSTEKRRLKDNSRNRNKPKKRRNKLINVEQNIIRPRRAGKMNYVF